MMSNNYELFRIQRSNSEKGFVENIVINEKQTKKFFQQFKEEEIFQTTGYYGSLAEVQKELLNDLKISTLQNCCNDDSKIFGIQKENIAVICLILPDTFFISKPLDEKSIVLTLFKIFSDLVENFQICCDQAVLQNWYKGDKFPFSNLPTSSCISINQKLKEKDIILEEYSLPKNLIEDQLLQINQTTNFIQVNNMTTEEYIKKLQKQCEEFAKAIQKKIISKDQSEDMIDKLFQKNEEIQQYLCYDEYIKHFKNIYSSNFQTQQKKKNFQKQNILNQYITDQSKQIIAFTKEIKSSIEQVMIFQRYDLQLIYDNSGCIINKINFQKRNSMSSHFKIPKQNEQLKIFNRYVNIKAPQYYLSYIQTQKMLRLKEIFKLSNETEIFIFQRQNNLILYQVSQKNLDLIQLEEIEEAENGYFSFNHKLNSLFLFNIKKNQYVIEYKFSQKFQKEQYSLPKTHQFIVQQSIFLKKMIVLRANDRQFFTTIDFFQNVSKANLKDKNGIPIYKNSYFQMIQCPSQRYFYLADGTNCEMYDRTMTQIKIIQIPGLNLTIVSQDLDVLVLNLLFKSSSTLQIVVFKNLLDESNSKIVTKEETQVVGNPVIDIMKGANVKFGNFVDYIKDDLNYSQKIFVKSKDFQENISRYQQKLKLKHNELFLYDNICYQQRNLDEFKQFLISRTPIQLCQVENELLIPLVNGFRKKFVEKTSIRIDSRAQQLKFGHLEKPLEQIKQNIFVIGVIGEQSSGKSYLLNRIFGTRYSVSASRCTQGIWASLVKIETQDFLILDCEGLFSEYRSKKEEQLMMAFIISISDVTILNSGPTLTKHLVELLKNLSIASEQLQGQSLFQGFLNIIVRDVSSEDNYGIKNEFHNLLKTGEYSFLEKIFNDQISIDFLVNFSEKKQFNGQVTTLRNDFIKKARACKRWENGKQLMLTMKLILCQLEMFDKTDTYQLQQKIEIEQIINQSKLEWFQSLQKLAQIEFQENYNEPLNYQNYLSENMVKDLQEKLNKQLLQNLLQTNDDRETFNKNLLCIQENSQKQLLDIQQKIQQNLEIKFKNNNYSGEANYKMEQETESFQEFQKISLDSFSFCTKKCKQCYYQCTQFNTHKNYKQKLSQIQQEIKQLQQDLQQIDTEFYQYNFTRLQIQHNHHNYYNSREELIDKYHYLNIEVVDLRNQQQYQEIQKQYKQLEEDYNKAILNYFTDNELSSELTQILGPYQNFQQFHLDQSQLKQLDEKLTEIEKKIRDKQLVQPEQPQDLKAAFQTFTETQQYQNKISEFENQIRDREQTQDILVEFSQFIGKEITKLEGEKFHFDLASQIEFLEVKLQDQVIREKNIISQIHYYNQHLNILKEDLGQEKYQIQMKHFFQLEVSKLNQIYAEKQDLEKQERQLKKKSGTPQTQLQEIEQKIQDLIQNLEEYSIIESISTPLEDLSQENMENIYNEYMDKISLLNQQQHCLKIINLFIQSFLDLSKEQQQKINHQKRKESQELICKLKLMIQIILNKDMINEKLMKLNQQSNFQQQLQQYDQLIKSLSDFENQLEQVIEKIKKQEEQGQLQQKLNNLINLKNQIMQNQNVHSCQRSTHKCQSSCDYCEDKNNTCKFKAGHDKDHICEKPTHLCHKKCISSDCQNDCLQNFNHDNIHECEDHRYCKEKCQFCSNQCERKFSQDEHQHLCKIKHCAQKCYHCDEFCEKQHDHSLSDFHFCSKQFHECSYFCGKSGICTIVYDRDDQQQSNNQWIFRNRFESYSEYIQKGIREKCRKKIIKGSKYHDGDHSCFYLTTLDKILRFPLNFLDVSFRHNCESKCPGCNAYCEYEQGHKCDHHVSQHRNIQNGLLNFEDGIPQRRENCSQCCQRMGRGHYHLQKCQGGQNCLENQMDLRDFVRHSETKPDYDEILCIKFWKQYHWDHPASRWQMSEVKQCNYYCQKCGPAKKSLCKKEAEHSFSKMISQHHFPCLSNHMNGSGISICFVINAKSSMMTYLQSTRKIIHTILGYACEREIQKKFLMLFSAVVYQNHPTGIWDKIFQNTLKAQDFKSGLECIEFLQQNHVQDCIQFPQALLDGLYKGVQMNWKPHHKKILYLIADSPPHGREYHNKDDKYPNGCPCGLKQTQALQQMSQKGIQFKIIKLNEELEITIEEFSRDYSSIEVFQVDSPETFSRQIEEDILKALNSELEIYKILCNRQVQDLNNIQK